MAYASFYGLGRMIIEGLRTDSLYLGSIRVSQLIAGAAFVAGGAALLYFLHKKKKTDIPDEYQPLFEDTMDDMAADLLETEEASAKEEAVMEEVQIEIRTASEDDAAGSDGAAADEADSKEPAEEEDGPKDE